MRIGYQNLVYWGFEIGIDLIWILVLTFRIRKS